MYLSTVPTYRVRLTYNTSENTQPTGSVLCRYDLCDIDYKLMYIILFSICIILYWYTSMDEYNGFNRLLYVYRVSRSCFDDKHNNIKFYRYLQVA